MYCIAENITLLLRRHANAAIGSELVFCWKDLCRIQEVAFVRITRDGGEVKLYENGSIPRLLSDQVALPGRN